MSERSLSQGIRIRSRSSQNMKRTPSLTEVRETPEPNDFLNTVSELIESKKQISLILHFQRYKAYILERARQFKKFTATINPGVLMMLINSRHFNLGLQQMLIKLLKLNRVSLSLDNFDPRSFSKVQSWMITYLKRYLDMDTINKKIETNHKSIQGEISAYLNKVFDKRFEPWLRAQEK